MKRRLISVLNVVVLGACVLSVSAEDLSGFTISPSVGINGFDDKDEGRDLEDSGFGSLGFGYQFNNPWALEFTYTKADTQTESGGVDTDYDSLSLNALYHFNRTSPTQPYIYAGVGQGEFESAGTETDETQVNFGIGIKRYVSENMALRADLGLVRSVDSDNDNDEEYNDLRAGIGFSYLIGGAGYLSPVEEKALVIVAIDSDGDGVVDSRDVCPNTPVGREVSANGCQYDSDRDGVIDFLDKCPNSAAEAVVDKEGCYILITESKTIDLYVEFDTNSAAVPAKYEKEIEQVARFMKQYPLTDVVLEGHTDSRGSARYNKALSERRAKSVAEILTAKFGIDASRVSSIGYGEARPIAPNDTPLNLAKNRRVSAVISAQTEKIKTK